MIKTLTYSLVFLMFFACKKTPLIGFNSENSSPIIENNAEKFGIVIHGGAGTVLKENMSDSLEKVYSDKLKEAIGVGHAILKNGGTAMEAVTKTINVLEDSPLFNAGKGAVFTHEGTNELDASVMDGATLKAGAVAGVRHIKNPINLAYTVMTQSEHVMLAGEGAERFAVEKGFTLVDTSYFYTEEQFQTLQGVKESEKRKKRTGSVPHEASFNKNTKFGTVGCAALDKYGNLAAGTSTGGMTNKRWNRIGDAPIIGAGTYANNATCAVSSTGWGEYFIRSVVAYDISALMEYKGWTLQQAAEEVIQRKVPALGGDGGIVAIDKEGNVAMEFNTPGMYRAHMNAKGELVIRMYKE